MPGPVLAARRGGASAAVGEHARPGVGAKKRNGAERRRGEQTGTEREDGRRAVDPDFIQAGESRGAKADEQSRRDPGQTEAHGPAGDREQDAFREEVAGDRYAARAKRAANGHVALPRLGANEEQVRD